MAQMLGMDHCVAILLDEEAGMLTGQTRGTLSFREGKVVRINQLFAGKEHLWQGSFGYSDSHNDLPMLRAVSHPHAVNPAPPCASAPRSWAGPLDLAVAPLIRAMKKRPSGLFFAQHAIPEGESSRGARGSTM